MQYKVIAEAKLGEEQLKGLSELVPDYFTTSQIYPANRRQGRVVYCSVLHLTLGDRQLISRWQDKGILWIPLDVMGLNQFQPTTQVLLGKFRSEGFDHVIFPPDFDPYPDFPVFPLKEESAAHKLETAARMAERLLILDDD